MKPNKAKRLSELFDRRLQDRLSSARYRILDHWEGLGLTQREQSFWPTGDQMIQFEPLASFVQLDAELDRWGPLQKEWEGRLKGLLEPTLESIRLAMQELELDLVRKLPSPASVLVNDSNRVLELATSVFVVGKSETSSSSDVHVYFGREVLQAVRAHANWLEHRPFSELIPVSFSETGAAAVRYILGLCKLKTSTTIPELDASHDAQFICTSCEPTTESLSRSEWGKRVPCRRVLSWRMAVSVFPLCMMRLISPWHVSG